MVVRRRAFALVIVLIAAAAAFTLAVQGAVIVRTSTIERGARMERAQILEAARSAAIQAALGLTSAPEGSRDGAADGLGSTGDAQAPGATPPEPEAPDIPELPEEIRNLLGEMIKETDKAAEPFPAAQTGVGAQNTERRRTRASRLSRRSLGDGPFPVRVDGQLYFVQFEDVTGRLNVNRVEESQLRRFLEASHAPPNLALSIAHELLDWRDEDDFVRSRGAEREQYVDRRITPRNGPLQTIDELRLLPSMTPELFERLRPDITIMGDGVIHAPSASRSTLLSIEGLTVGAVDQIVRLRRTGGLTEEALRDAMPLGAKDVMDQLRVNPKSALVATVWPDSRPDVRVQIEVQIPASGSLLTSAPRLAPPLQLETMPR